jgi:malate dehydrogenase (oxaloacetate-decarboxylating)
VQGRPVEGLRVVVSGAGAAGVACARILLGAGVRDIVVLDSRGVIDAARGGEKAALAAVSNPRAVTGGIAEALAGADVFVGLSGGTLPEELLALMAPEAIVFALSNPDPEVHPDVARRHAAIVATGRSDFPNQINNVLAFPGVFRGALDAGARRITERMKIAAADAIFAVARDDLGPDRIVPSPFDPRVAPAVSAAVAAVAE